jgi:DNA-binding MarR family transcriptional regulator
MKRGNPSSDTRYKALLQLLRAADTLWNRSHAFFACWNLSPSQFNVLNLLLDPADGLSQIELGRLLITHRSNVTGLIDRLEKRGLVRRRDAVKDRRAYRVGLTAEGRKLVHKILPNYYQMAEEVWGGFPAERAEQMTADLERLCANMEKLMARKGDP